MIKAAVILVIALTCHSRGAELGLDGLGPNELKEIEKEIAAGNVPPNYAAEKPIKRGAKINTPADGTSYNQIGNLKPQLAVSTSRPQQQQPYRYVYTQPAYVPANPYLQYFQNQQLPTQLTYQSSAAYQSAVPHYLQTPTQIQYVSPPSYAPVPSPAFKSLTKEAPATQTSEQAQKDAQSVAPQSSQQAVQTPASNYYQPQQYQQYLMLLLSPQAQIPQQAPFIYPGYQQQMYFVGQHPFAGLYNQQQRLPYQPQQYQPQQYQAQQYQPQQQVTYLAVPGTQTQQGQAITATEQVSDSKANVALSQESSNAYGTRTKV